MKTFFRRVSAASLSFVLANPASAYHSIPGKTITIDGRKYAVIQEENNYGVLVKQVLVAPDFEEISLDTNADGTVDQWELSNGRLTFSASQPFRGNFTVLEVSERGERGIKEVKLTYSRDENRYFVASSRTRPYTNMKKDEKLTIGSCLQNDPSLAEIQKDFRAALERISSDDISRRKAQLVKELTSSNPEKIDSSCRTGKFEKTTEALVNGMAEVLVSGTQATSSRPTFLKCLENYNLGLHAARIERNYLNIGKAGGPKAFMCGAAAGVKLKGTEHGEYFKGEDLIRFYKTLEDYTSKNSSTLTSGTKTAERLYANAYFHEALHQSGIDDEKLVGDAEGCCGGYPGLNPDTEQSKQDTACRNLEKTTLDLKTKQIMETLAWESVDGYQQIMSETERLLGQDQMDDFQRDFSLKLYNARVKAGDQYAACIAKKDKIVDCAEQYATALKEAIESSFIKTCESKVRYLSRRGQDLEGDECNRLGTDLAHAFFAHRLKCGQVKAWYLPVEKINKFSLRLFEILFGSIRATAVDFKTCSASDFASFSTDDIQRTGQMTTQLGSADYKQTESELRRFSIGPREQQEERIDRVTNAQPIRRDEIYSGPVSTQPIRLGQATETRRDIAARTNRATAIFDRAASILKLPEAQAASNEIASYSARINSRASNNPRGQTLSAGSSYKAPRSPASVENFFQEINGLTKPSTPNATTVASLSSPGQGMKVGVEQSASSSQPHSAPVPLADGPKSKSSSRGRSLPGGKASQAPSSNEGEGAAMSANASASTTANGPTMAGAAGGTAGTGGAVGMASLRAGASLPQGAASVKVVNPLRKDYPDRMTLEKFLTGDYHKVARLLKNSDFSMLLIDESLRVVDSRGANHGSRHPEATVFEYDHDQGLLVKKQRAP